MPRGSEHILTGTLCWTPRGYALQMDDGGQWSLDLKGRADRYIDRRVTVEGTRSGFDLLDVHRIGLGDRLPPRRAVRLRIAITKLMRVK